MEDSFKSMCEKDIVEILNRLGVCVARSRIESIEGVFSFLKLRAGIYEEDLRVDFETYLDTLNSTLKEELTNSELDIGFSLHPSGKYVGLESRGGISGVFLRTLVGYSGITVNRSEPPEENVDFFMEENTYSSVTLYRRI